jgi:hypothetical protein
MIRPVPVENDFSELIDDAEINPGMQVNQVSAIKSAVKCQSGSGFSDAIKAFDPQFNGDNFKIPS